MSRRLFLQVGLGAVGVTVLAGGAGHYGATRLNTIGEFDPDALAALRQGRASHLLERWPGLGRSLPWRPLGVRDTVVEELPPQEGARDVRLFVKRDDRTSGLYGGNKARKLEHYLAEAELAGSRVLVTLGGIGSHQALATALHGRSVGLPTRAALFGQPVTPPVVRNVRGLATAAAEIRYSDGFAGAALAARGLLAEAKAAGEEPYFIPVGGMSRLGTIAYVNAALELAQQVLAGLLPEPDRIVVALGSGGTAAGLAAGCRLAGLRTRITAVRVGTRLTGNRVTVAYLASDVAAWLHAHDPALPRIRIRPGDIDIIGDQLGGGYGHPTEAGGLAADFAWPRFVVDPTYTAKALAGALAHCRRSARPGEVVLYWHTLNAASFPLAESLEGLPSQLVERLAATAWTAAAPLPYPAHGTQPSRHL
jgi:D-cysteine desulfhydrase